MTQGEGLSWMSRVEAECIRRGAPEGWRLSVSQLLGNYPNYTHYQFDGAVYPPISRGPRKGRPNYRKPIQGTKRTFILSVDEVRSI